MRLTRLGARASRFCTLPLLALLAACAATERVDPERNRSQVVATSPVWRGPAGSERSTPLFGVEAPSSRTPTLPPPPPPRPVRETPMFDGATGDAIDWNELLNRAAVADIVIIGEVHGHERGLAVASAFFEDILPRTAAALSLEFFERDEQIHVDDYLAGVTDEEAFKKVTGRTANSYPAGHKEMVENAKRWGRPVVASNAPRRYARLARTDGLDRLRGLDEEQQRTFTVPGAVLEGSYRERFFELMKPMMSQPSHGATDEEPPTPEEAEAKTESFYLSQNVWDATMAASIVDALQEGNRPVVHVVGQFHSDFDGGLVTRLRAELPQAVVFTVSMVTQDAPESGPSEEDYGRAAVLVYVGEAKE